MNIEDLYDRFGEKLYSYLSFMLRSVSDAEDVLQEVFCRLVRYSTRLSLVKRPASFVFRVTRNEALRFLEKRGRINQKYHASALEGVIQDIVTGPDPSDVENLAKAMAAIPEDQREVIFLKFFEDLTFKEIAAISGVTTNTAASRYRYGIKKLRHFMEGKG